MTQKLLHILVPFSPPKMWKIPTNQYFPPTSEDKKWLLIFPMEEIRFFFTKPMVADHLQELNHMMLDHMDTENSTFRDAACRWVKSNRERWRDWRLRYH